MSDGSQAAAMLNLKLLSQRREEDATPMAPEMGTEVAYYVRRVSGSSNAESQIVVTTQV